MAKLSPEQQTILITVFQATKDGLADFVLLQESSLLEDLLQAKLIKLQIEESENGENWYAALTEKGASIAQDLYQKQFLIRAEIPFDTSDAQQARLIQKLAELEMGERGAFLAYLFDLYAAGEEGNIDALMNAHPKILATIQQMIRASVDSQMMAQEQHRINHLLGEISELKTMLSQQAQHQQQQAPAPRLQPVVVQEEDDDDDDAPIPPPKPVTLRPVLPHTPQGQPKQLAVPQFALPHDDEESEDLFVVRKDAEAGKRASQNFIQSLNRLQKP